MSPHKEPTTSSFLLWDKYRNILGLWNILFIFGTTFHCIYIDIRPHTTAVLSKFTFFQTQKNTQDFKRIAPRKVFPYTFFVRRARVEARIFVEKRKRLWQSTLIQLTVTKSWGAYLGGTCWKTPIWKQPPNSVCQQFFYIFCIFSSVSDNFYALLLLAFSEMNKPRS